MSVVYAYIDGFNLYYRRLKDLPDLKWLDVHALLVRMLPNDEIRKIRYFSAPIPYRSDDPGRGARQQAYVRALKTIPCLELTMGKYTTNTVSMPLAGSNPIRFVDVSRTDEKRSDVNLASALLMDGVRGLYEKAVVVTNDSDQVTPVRIVRDELRLPIGILHPHDKSDELAAVATFQHFINKSDLRACQFPENTLTDANGPIIRPTSWR